MESLIYAKWEFCGVVTKGIHDCGDNKSIASLLLPGLLVPSQFLHTVCSVFLNTPMSLTESSLTHIFLKSLLIVTQAKEIPRTTKCAHQNIQKSWQQKEKKHTIAFQASWLWTSSNSWMSLQLLHLKMLQIQPCSEDSHSQYPLEAWRHPTIQQTHASRPEGNGFSADNIQSLKRRLTKLPSFGSLQQKTSNTNCFP